MTNEEIKILVNERTALLNEKKAYNFAKLNPNAPEVAKQRELLKINAFLGEVEEILPPIKELIQTLRNKIETITEQSYICAVYLLLGKAFSNLESTLLLGREGKSFEAMEICRSGKEALDLVYLFLECENAKHLEKWFEGKIVENKIARDFQHEHLNRELKENFPDHELPVDVFKAGIYKVLSAYTHSSYAGILDCIDVFNHDFDFDKRAGYHYILENSHVVEDLARQLVQMLRFTFIKLNDQESLLKANALYQHFDNDISEEEYERIIAEHINKKAAQ
jgi:hypothetical protein